VRACLEAVPACKALLKRLRTEALRLLECQKIVTTQGRSHDPRGQCEPRLAAMPSAALRLECRAALDFPLETATTRGLDHVGLSISAETIAALVGVAKPHGAGETQDAARIALRLPAFCGAPTREEAEQVLQVSGARPQACTAPCTSLPQQRRAVLGRPERLESLSLHQTNPHVERMPRPKNRSNHQEILSLSNGYEKLYGPQLAGLDAPILLDKAAPPGSRETALTS